MALAGQIPVAPFTVAKDLTISDLRNAFAAGWRDFLAYPAFGLFFAGFYAVGGALVYGAMLKFNMSGWFMTIAAGFPLLAPFAVVGLYEVSRLRGEGEPVTWKPVFRALGGKGEEQQVLMIGIILFVAFSFWMILAHGIFAIFLGESGIGSESTGLFLSYEAIAMLLVGSFVGALVALALFAITVTSLPMLVDHDIDFITAMIVSMGVVRSNRLVMILWAIFMATLMFVAMVPMMLGLFVVLPVLGHASWHLFRRAVRPTLA
jgi:uncharacterized membrane protein